MKTELELKKERRFKRGALTVGIVINAIILFLLGIFTFLCIGWSHSNYENPNNFPELVIPCILLLVLLIFQIIAVIRLSETSYVLRTIKKNNKKQNLEK